MNITPAIDFEKLSSNMSAEEFQEKLYTWLQRKGLLCELRNYFRTNMIALFSKTAAGNICDGKEIKPVTPKQYATNLLIAEFLILAECHYTLSIFCAEASVVNTFPCPAKDYNFQGFQFDERGSKFSETVTRDILETLGVLEEADLCDLIHHTYYNTTDPLLTCILTAKLSSTNIIRQIETGKDSDDGFEFAIKNINKLLRNSNLSNEHRLQIKQHIKQMHRKEKEKSLLAEKNLKQKYKNEIAKCKREVETMQSEFNSERMHLEKTVREFEILLGIRGQEQNKTGEYFFNENAENLPLNVDTSKKLTLMTRNVENIQLELLLKQLQIENKNLNHQNAERTKQLQSLSNAVDVLLHNLKSLCDNKTTDLQLCKNKTDGQTLEKYTFDYDDVVGKAQHKLKMLELECENMNSKYVKRTLNTVTS